MGDNLVPNGLSRDCRVLCSRSKCPKSSMNLSLRWSGEFIVRDLTHITISPRRLFCRVDPWGRFPMRIFALIAAFALVSIAPALAGEARSLSLQGVDQKLPGALGQAAERPGGGEGRKRRGAPGRRG